jgi:hypothetical protein
MLMDEVLQGFALPEKDRILTKGNHPLKDYFELRQITQTKLAKYFGTNKPYMSEMFRGIRFMPPDIEKKLYDLKAKIDRWEIKSGKRFNS